MNRSTLSLVILVSLAGCNQNDAADPESSLAVSTRNHLVWKRAHAVEQDLAQALELPAETLCTELGQFSCTREVHLASLGGHDPFEQGLHEPLAQPLVTTPLALDRVVLSACGQRVEQDTQSPVVFTGLDLANDAPSADSESFAHTIRTLYQRLLGREPIEAELAAHARLVVGDDGAPVSAVEFAHLACYTIATTTEFLFI